MKNLIRVFIFLSLSSAHAYHSEIKVYNTLKKITGETNKKRIPTYVDIDNGEKELLVYDSPDSKSNKKTYSIDLNSWKNFDKKENARFDFMNKLFAANTKDLSNSNQKHIGCFFGDAEALAKDFFSDSDANTKIANISDLFVTVSEDRKMIGFEYNFKYFGSEVVRKAHFRLPHCVQGAKSPLFQLQEALSAQKNNMEKDRQVASFDSARQPANISDVENGFEVFDKLNPADEKSALSKKLPRFNLRADYDQMRPNYDKRPWKNLDISTEEGGKKFAQVILDYFYDSLVQDERNPNNNFIATNIKKDAVQWCHMPWLNVGDAGREMIHGLTKERDLEKSEIYPEVGSTPEKQGSDWGVGFYNDIACAAIGKVFGSLPGGFNKQDVSSKIGLPDFTQALFPDGSVSVKTLFTTANLDALKGSFAWTGNISLPKSTTRRLREVKMLQIDVAVKDSTLKGVRKEADGWMMTTYYYDASYVSPSAKKFKGSLAGLLKMRPIGIQTGFDPSTSIIFAGSKTNSADNIYYGAKPMLVNGPADNPKTSCLSCHGVAGTQARMVPGVKDFNEYSQLKPTGLDFSQQISMAKRNYETRAGQLAASDAAESKAVPMPAAPPAGAEPPKRW